MHPLPLPRGEVVPRQLLRLEGAVAAGDDHCPRAQLAPVGVKHGHALLALALPRDRLGRRVQMHGHIELLDRLLAQHLHEVPRQDLRVARDGAHLLVVQHPSQRPHMTEVAIRRLEQALHGQPWIVPEL